MRIEIRRARTFEGAEAAIADALESFAVSVVRSAALVLPDGAPTVRLVLGGEAEARAWSIPANAVGFVAVAAMEESEDGQCWIEVNERVEAHVNVVAAAAELEREHDAAALESLLATASHELLHARDWIVASGGMTPLEVFDAGDGELALKDMLQAAARLRAAEGDGEAETEEAAMALVAAYGLEAAEALAAAISGPGPGPG